MTAGELVSATSLSTLPNSYVNSDTLPALMSQWESRTQVRTFFPYLEQRARACGAIDHAICIPGNITVITNSNEHFLIYVFNVFILRMLNMLHKQQAIQG